MPQGSPLTFKEICMEIYWFLNRPVGKKPGRKRPRPGADEPRHLTGAGGEKTPFVLEGELHYAVRTICSIQGEEFIVSPKTWVVGNIEEGSLARVKGVIKRGEKYATNIVIGKGARRA